MLATAGVTRTLAADVTALAQGGGLDNYAIVLSGDGVGITLQQVTALAENGSSGNIGLLNEEGAAATLHGGAFTGRGGAVVRGIYNADNDTRLEAEGVTALGEGASGTSWGLYNRTGAAATLRHSSSTGRGGTIARGIFNDDPSTLETLEVSALGEKGSDDNCGLYNRNGAAATLRGGSFTGRGGAYAYGIYSRDSGTTLDAQGVAALADQANEGSYGLYNFAGAAAMLRSGSSIGRGGAEVYGIYNDGSGTTLEAESVTVVGENGMDLGCGLRNATGAAATLRGGSFTGRAMTDTYGIDNTDNGTVLGSQSIVALAESGSDYNYGLRNFDGAVATLRSGSFTGRGGQNAGGIRNVGESAQLEAEGVTALGENASGYNFGLINAVYVSATLRGGSFTARGGTEARTIYNSNTGARLAAQGVTALGQGGSFANYGLLNHYGATATVRGGTFTAQGEGSAYGIRNGIRDSTLEAEGVTALGEGEGNFSIGLSSGGAVTLRGGSLTGRGGNRAYGIWNNTITATLEAQRLTVVGENGGDNYGLYNTNDATTNVIHGVLEGATKPIHHDDTGSVAISNSRLVGVGVPGTVTCTLVTRGITVSVDGFTCP
jgi:hypothetical protein